MCMQDPISDMLTRIRNALSSGKPSVSFPASEHKSAILKVLQDEGYIASYSVSGDAKKTASVDLKFYEGKPVISKICRISTPGLRIYRSVADLAKDSANSLETLIVSTSGGVMTAVDAKRKNLGGEVLVKVK